MKKYFKYAYVSAIALLGASGFTACSSEDALVDVEEPQAQVVEDSPLYDPATGLVRSQFVLNIASQAQPVLQPPPYRPEVRTSVALTTPCFLPTRPAAKALSTPLLPAQKPPVAMTWEW